MKKRLILGDMHGLIDVYQKIYKKENPDEVICLGDYVDSFDVDVKYQEQNMKYLVEMKDNHTKGNFIILLGNHDFQYLYGYPQYERYSGFSWTTFHWAHEYFNKLVNEKKIQIIYIDNINKTIFSHAGICNTWFNDWQFKSLEDINNLFTEEVGGNLEPLKFALGEDFNPYGDSVWNGCTWIREKSLLSDMYKDQDEYVWNQIVGHTPSNKVRVLNDGKLIIADAIGKKHSEYIIQTLSDDNILISMDINII